MKTRVIAFIVLLLVVSSGFAAWFLTKPKTEGDEAKGGKGRPPVAVPIVQARVQPMPILLEADGTIEPEQSVAVRSQVNGTLQAVLFKEGDYVQAGQPLFQVDPSTFRAAVEQGRAAVARDQAQAAEARAQQQRLAPLVAKEYVTRQEYSQASAQAAATSATVDANRAQLKEAELQLERSRIRAPIAGRTGSLKVKQGNLVVANATDPLVVINGTRPVLASFTIPQQRLADVRRFREAGELKVEVSREKGKPAVATGKLTFIDNAVDQATGTVRLKARLDNEGEAVWPGEFVAVRLTLGMEPEAVVVPEPAVQPGQQGAYVYVVEEGKARIQPIKVARQVDAAVVVASGLKGGEQLVAAPPQGLRPGAAVRPLTEAEMRGGPPGEKRGGKGGGNPAAKPAGATP